MPETREFVKNNNENPSSYIKKSYRSKNSQIHWYVGIWVFVLKHLQGALQFHPKNGNTETETLILHE
jgi:hypothetical protein